MDSIMKLVAALFWVALLACPVFGNGAGDASTFEETTWITVKVSDDGITDAEFDNVLVQTVTILNSITAYMNGVVAQAKSAQSVEQVVALFDSIPGQIQQFKVELGKIGAGNVDAYSRRLQYSNDARLKGAIQEYQQANSNFILGLSSLSPSILYDSQVQAAMRRLKSALGM